VDKHDREFSHFSGEVTECVNTIINEGLNPFSASEFA
jgi:hypothetical protein